MKSTALKSWRHLITGSAACTLLIGGLLFLQQTDAQRRSIANVTAPAQNGVYQPTQRKIEAATPISIAEAAKIDAGVKYNRPFAADSDGPGTRPQGMRDLGVPITRAITDSPTAITAPTPSSSGVSAPPTQTFKGEYLSGTTIPPDTMGAVGTAFVVTSTNDRLRIQDRNGNELSRVSITSFWNGTQVKGVNVGSAFDTKVLYDRFNNRFILVSSLNGPSINSGLGLAVSQTNDPTGVWNRYTIASDPASTATAGHGIDYPSVGFNKNWIVIDENVFNYTGTGFSTYYGQQIFVADKQAAYAGSLSSFSLFEGQYNAGAACSSNNTLGCGFTMAPAIVEDNTTDTVYMAEDWDDTQAQLRLSKITGTPAAPVLTIATQFPQSIQSWRGDAARIGTSGGYLPQRESFSYQGAAQRIMANDARIQNTVYRAGSLWTTHTVMLANTPTPAGTCVGGTTAGCPTDAIIDDHSGIQWWQINPTIETGLSTPPLQRGRIEDTTADNCHDGNAGTRTTGTCTSVATQVGTFFAFPNISVNQNNDVLIGFSQFSPLTHPTAAYAIRRSSDALNTMRDPIAFRDGQSRYNIGGGTANTTARQNRWGDYSAAQTDPLDDTTFWTVQEYAGTTRNFGIGLAGNWETWWANVNPATAAPSTSGNLIISEFRLRGPQGANDEYVELYNPSSTAPVYVNTTDNSDGWALAYSSDGTTITPRTVIPNGTVIPPNGHFLITRGPDNANGPTATYSLNTYPGRGQQPISGTTEAVTQRGADSDTSYDLDNADNGGFAIFKTANPANMTAATRMDSVGFANIAAALFKEGNGIPTISATTPTGQYTFYRDLSNGAPRDTNVNENDFIFVDPVNEAFTLQPRLGAAGPKNVDSPIARAVTQIRNFDTTKPTGSDPNQVYDPTPVTNGANGSVVIRRTLVNNTGQPITRLRFRIASTSTLNGPGGGTLDLRLLSSSDSTATTNDPAQCGGAPPCTVTVRGTTIETPPAQPLGGGWNSSASAAVVTMANPIPAGGRMHVSILFGVQTGTPLVESPLAAIPVTIIAETLVPNPTTVPTAATVSLSGRVLTADGHGIRTATVSLTKPNGEVVTAITNAFGYYSFEQVQSGESVVLNARARGATFQPRVVSVTDELADVDLIAR